MDYLKRKVYDPLMDLLRRGLSPKTISLSLSFGIVGGLFPIPGITSVICFIFTYLFSLNLVATQIANFVMTPLDFALVVPFIKMGDWILGESLSSDFSEKLQSDFWGSLSQFRVAIFHGIFAWALFSSTIDII